MSRQSCDEEAQRILAPNSWPGEDPGTRGVDSASSLTRYSACKYGSIANGVGAVPQKLVPLLYDKNGRFGGKGGLKDVQDNTPERRYSLRNGDLLLEDDKCQQDFQVKSKDTKPKQNSIVTIFSIWNTILGSSLLTMPWGILMAGLIPGIILILTMSGLCLYTAYQLLQVHKYHGGGERIEVIELSRMYFGEWAASMAKVFSITVLLGATIAYWILMSNFLYYSVNFLYDFVNGKTMQMSYRNESVVPEVVCSNTELLRNISNERTYDNLGPGWDLFQTVPIFLAFIIFPLLNFNSTTFFTKFNSLGTISIAYLIIFIIIKSASWGINMKNETWQVNITLRSTFPILSGMLSLSFFIHNIIISIMESNRNQQKNGRDLTAAYILVTLTYTVVGIVFYVCFPLDKSCIEDNFLNNFQKTDKLTVAARLVLFFQLLTVYPLIAFMLRTQIISSIFKKSNSVRCYTILINIVVVTICILFAMFLPRVGTIIRYTGAVSGLIYIFTLPCLLHLVMIYRQGKLKMISVFFHSLIPVIGLLNFASQFIIRESK